MNPVASPSRDPAEADGFLRLPHASTVFRERALRFRTLALRQTGLTGFLALLAQIADAQHAACQAVGRDAWSDGTTAAPDRERSPAPFPTHGPAPPAWRAALGCVLDHMPVPEGPMGRVVTTLRALPPDVLDAHAVALLSGDPGGIDRGAATVIAAALQAFWTAQTQWLDTTTLAPDRGTSRCPVCDSLPVASLRVTGGDRHGLRYLCCSLCSAQWNLPRIRCVHCGATGGIAYYAIDGSDGMIRAEACGDCRAYTKLLNQEQQADLDPFADDLASLPLDLMLADAGYLRFGVNPFLIPGD